MERTAPEIISTCTGLIYLKILIRLPVPYSIRLAITTIPVIQAACPYMRLLAIWSWFVVTQYSTTLLLRRRDHPKKSTSFVLFFGMISLLSHTIRTTINCEFDAVKQHLIAYPGYGKLLGCAVLIRRQRRE